MVIDQGTLLDSVEYNVEQTAVQVSQAVKELDVATKFVFSDVILTSSLPDHETFRYQKNTGRRSCIFLLLLIIFGLIIVLIFKPRRHSTSTVTPQPPSSGDLLGDAVADGLGDAPSPRWTLRRAIPT